MGNILIFLSVLSLLATVGGRRIKRQSSGQLPTVGLGSPSGAFGTQLSLPPPFNAPPYSDGTLGFPTYPQLKYRWGFGVDVLPRADNVIFDGRIRTNSLPSDIGGRFRSLKEPVGVKFSFDTSPHNTYRRAGLSDQELREELTRILLAQMGIIIPASENPYNYLFQNSHLGGAQTSGGSVRKGGRKDGDIVGKSTPLTKTQKKTLKKLAALAKRKQRLSKKSN